VPYLSFLVCCIVWGGSFILMDRAALAFGPLDIAIGRMALGALVVAAYCQLTGRWIKITGRDYVHLVTVSFFANVWPYVVQPCVMRQAGEHAFFGMFMAFVPLTTIVASIPMLGALPTPRQLVGVLGGLACMMMVMWDGSHRGIPLTLLALSVSVPISYAVGNTYIKWKLDHLSAAPLTAVFLAIGALMLVPLRLAPTAVNLLRLEPPTSPHDAPLAFGALLILGVGGTGLCILLFVQMVKTRGPLFAGMVTYIIPLVALLWGQVDHERLSALQVAAMAGVLAMVALVQWRPARPVDLVEMTPTAEPPA
jgi:drug/metabolite transporter (DMT)-like permease